MRDPIRQALLDRCKGKDVVMLGPLGDYDCYRVGDSTKFWDFALVSEVAKSAVGLDINQAWVDLARKDGWNVRFGNAENFTADADIVYAPDLIEHIGDLTSCLTSCRNAIRADGQIIMETPNPHSIGLLLKGIFGEVDHLEEHTCWIDEGNMQELARRAGLVVSERIHYTPINQYGFLMGLRTRLYRGLEKLFRKPRFGAKIAFVLMRGQNADN